MKHFLISLIFPVFVFATAQGVELTSGCDEPQSTLVSEANRSIYEVSSQILNGIATEFEAHQNLEDIDLQIRSAGDIVYCIQQASMNSVHYQCADTTPNQDLLYTDPSKPFTIQIAKSFLTNTEPGAKDIAKSLYQKVAKSCGAKEELRGLRAVSTAEKPWGFFISSFEKWYEMKAFCVPGQSCSPGFEDPVVSEEASPWKLVGFNNRQESAVLSSRLQDAYYRGLELLQEVKFTAADPSSRLAEQLIQIEGTLECSLNHLPKINYLSIDTTKHHTPGTRQSRANSATYTCAPTASGQLFSNCEGDAQYQENVQIFSPNYFHNTTPERQMSVLIHQAGHKCNLIDDENQFLNRGLPPADSTYVDKRDGVRKTAPWMRITYTYEHWMLYGFCIPGQTCTTP